MTPTPEMIEAALQANADAVTEIIRRGGDPGAVADPRENVAKMLSAAFDAL